MKLRTNLSSECSDLVSHDPACGTQVGAVILFGRPGVGKGTQAARLSKIWHVPHISTGDLLRTNVTRGTRLGRIAKEFMNVGDLVPDSLIKEMVETRLLESDSARGCILDGFPRTLEQAIWLIEKISLQQVPLFGVHIHVNQAQLVSRITGRRHCPVCRSTFNIHDNPPRREGLCDRDRAQLVQRPDDSEEILNRRLRAYDIQTAPVIEHFRKLGRFAEISGDGPIEWITERILGARQWHVAFEPSNHGLQRSVIHDRGFENQ